MYVPESTEEGLYNLYFHACQNYQRDLFKLNFQVSHLRKKTMHSGYGCGIY